MRSLLFVYTLIALSLASPVPDLEARGGGGYGGFPGFGFGIGGTAISGDSGNVNGGSVENVASPWGSVTNVWGSGEYRCLDYAFMTEALVYSRRWKWWQVNHWHRHWWQWRILRRHWRNRYQR